MSEAQQEHDNSWLKPYLKKIQDAGGAMYKDECEATFKEVYDGIVAALPDDVEEPGYLGASKIRQTMYISKLAKHAKDEVILTDKGLEFLSE